MATHYFRRTDPVPRRGWFRPSIGQRFELWQANGKSAVLTRRELDDLLDARRFPADFWAAVNSAHDAFNEGDRESWIESGTGRRVVDPLDAEE